MTGAVRRVRPSELTDGPDTAGMQRREAVATERLWSGLVHTQPGMVSAWHHHGEHESVIYVAKGALRMEWGADGREVFNALAGEFVFVPPYAVHREGNTTTEVSTLVVSRSGEGESVFNVDGPAGGSSPPSADET
jgi:uncharacterized RmlC-like cupin family protein